MDSGLLSRSRTFTTVRIYMQPDSQRAVKTWKQTLTCCSRTYIFVAAICPELIETWVSESFDSLVGHSLRPTISRSKGNMRRF